MKASDAMKSFAMKQMYSYIDKDPDNNIPKLLDLLESSDKNGNSVTDQVKGIRSAIQDKDSNWYKLVKSLWTDIDDGQRRALIEAAVINASLIGTPITIENQEKYGCNIPWAILMDPTSACNLHCTGCWAAEYGNKLNLTLDELDSIIRQGKELGTYIYIYSGGEPLVRKNDLIKLCEKHKDCAFLAFTNGTLIDDAFADEMLRVKNFVPAISIEGFEEATDFRRGAGTYHKVIEAMQRLKQRKLLFGISCCYTSKNAEVIGSEEYIDSMIDIGAKFAWLFTYMPIGADAVPELMVSAEQRKFMYDQIHKFRQTKPLFTMDFWNDGDAVGGCIAGGRGYCHINANGDVEPCAFVPSPAAPDVYITRRRSESVIFSRFSAAIATVSAANSASASPRSAFPARSMPSVRYICSMLETSPFRKMTGTPIWRWSASRLAAVSVRSSPMSMNILLNIPA
mgnify:CR=1 FL=1